MTNTIPTADPAGSTAPATFIPFMLSARNTEELRRFFFDGLIPAPGARVQLVCTNADEKTVTMAWQGESPAVNMALMQLANALAVNDMGRIQYTLDGLASMLPLPGFTYPRDHLRESMAVFVAAVAAGHV